MKTFNEFLMVERFVNILGNSSQKDEYAQVVWDLLQKSYEKIGGLKGRGFSSIDDMKKSIPFWKLVKKNGEIVAGAMYRDKNGRKRVAIFTNGTDVGKTSLAQLMKDDFSRAYFEVSDGSLGFMVKTLGVDFVKKYAKSPDEVSKITGDEIQDPPEGDSQIQKFPKLKEFFYQREIGGSMKTKILLGSTGNKIIISEEELK